MESWREGRRRWASFDLSDAPSRASGAVVMHAHSSERRLSDPPMRRQRLHLADRDTKVVAHGMDDLFTQECTTLRRHMDTIRLTNRDILTIARHKGGVLAAGAHRGVRREVDHSGHLGGSSLLQCIDRS